MTPRGHREEIPEKFHPGVTLGEGGEHLTFSLETRPPDPVPRAIAPAGPVPPSPRAYLI